MVGNEKKRHCLSVLPQIIHMHGAKNTEWYGAIESQRDTNFPLQNDHSWLQYTQSERHVFFLANLHKRTQGVFLSFKIQSEFWMKNSPSSFHSHSIE